MDTMQRYRDGPDEMDFHEALSKAVHKRKHLIKQKTDELKKEEDEQWIVFFVNWILLEQLTYLK